MIPHTKLGSARFAYPKLKVYAGPTSPPPGSSRRSPSLTSRDSSLIRMSQEFIATGRRKEAVARIRMSPAGQIDDQRTVRSKIISRPSRCRTRCSSRSRRLKHGTSYDVAMNTTGGGSTGQAGAVRLAIARALRQVGWNFVLH